MMFESFLDERFQRSICFLLLAEHCAHIDPENPAIIANGILEQFATLMKSEIKEIKATQDIEIKELENAETDVEQYVEKWRVALFQQFVVFKANVTKQ